jgi:acetyl-CoA acetyltransferase
MAVTTIANQIKAGQIQIGLALGVESMSQKQGFLPCMPF